MSRDFGQQTGNKNAQKCCFLLFVIVYNDDRYKIKKPLLEGV